MPLLAVEHYACRVIQCIIEHGSADQVTRIVDELAPETEQLSQDQYGHHVIEHVLKHARPDDRSKIINRLRGKFMVLGQHKFARFTDRRLV